MNTGLFKSIEPDLIYQGSLAAEKKLLFGGRHDAIRPLVGKQILPQLRAEDLKETVQFDF